MFVEVRERRGRRKEIILTFFQEHVYQMLSWPKQKKALFIPSLRRLRLWDSSLLLFIRRETSRRKPQRWQGHKHGQRNKFKVHFHHASEQWRSWDAVISSLSSVQLSHELSNYTKWLQSLIIALCFSQSQITGQQRSGASHFTPPPRHQLPFIHYSCKDSWEM